MKSNNIVYGIAHKYNIIKQLNYGRFGVIYKCENIRTKELVAIKMEKTNSSFKLVSRKILASQRLDRRGSSKT